MAALSQAEPVYVLGAGGHAKVIVSLLSDLGWPVEALFDRDPDTWGRSVLGVPVVGDLATFRERGKRPSVLAIGDNTSRRLLDEALPGIDWPPLVHPRAYVHASVILGPGTVVCAGAVVQPGVHVGRHAIINTGATVDHDVVLGDFVHVAPGANLAGGVRVEEGCLLGIGSSAVPGVSIGAWSIVGAGAVVVRDLPANVTAVGVPAQPIKTHAPGWQEG